MEHAGEGFGGALGGAHRESGDAHIFFLVMSEQDCRICAEKWTVIGRASVAASWDCPIAVCCVGVISLVPNLRVESAMGKDALHWRGDDIAVCLSVSVFAGKGILCERGFHIRGWVFV